MRKQVIITPQPPSRGESYLESIIKLIVGAIFTVSMFAALVIAGGIMIVVSPFVAVYSLLTNKERRSS